MTYKHYNAVIDEPLPFDSGIQRALYLEMCYRADNRGIVRTPQSQLAGLTLFSPRTVANEFLRLQELGLLAKESFGRYRLTFEENGKAGKEPFKVNTQGEPKSRMAKAFSLKKWIRDMYGEKNFQDGVIAIEEDMTDGIGDPLPDEVIKAIEEGVLSKGATSSKLGVSLYKFNPSKLP